MFRCAHGVRTVRARLHLAVGVVRLRSRQNGLRAEMYRLEARRVKVRRRLWNQQLRIGELDVTGPKMIR